MLKGYTSERGEEREREREREKIYMLRLSCSAR